MKVSILVPFLFLLTVLSTSNCFSNPMMLDNCKLDILDQLPERMQRICISFLSNMSREGIESLSHGGEDDTRKYQPANKRRDPDHVFLRFGRGNLW
eukprot:TRINITY_DN13881_c0_g1_i1.p1 TRINITY_DN13881_c0_g1~~TRINITY_DN13881_c0_g1_i1.p1  ORF type:complete len:110 (-),score=23.37 TRINITY_DN13881_c0_g1_i1:129-416(-)